MYALIMAAALSMSTVDLHQGTVMCRTESSAQEYLVAVKRQDEARLGWLMGSACYSLLADFKGQRVLGSSDDYIVVEWSNGRFSKVRYVVEPA